jgi:hypothetical protein
MGNTKRTIWDLFEKANAINLGRSLYRMVRSTTRYISETNKARRSEILFGANAGQKYLVKAEINSQKRIASLKAVKRNFKQFYDDLDENQKNKFSDYVNNGGLYRFTLNTKKIIMLELLKSNISPEETKKALGKLNTMVETAEKFKSTEQVNEYFYQHIDELVAWKCPIDWRYSLCLVVLSMTSALVIIGISAFFVCVSKLWQGEDVDCVEIYRQMVLDFCGLSE